MRARLERYFEFESLQASWETEIVAGLTTFATMAYIIFVNPVILHDAGMPLTAVTAATCLCAGMATIAMGIVARYPLALAPGMGLNAYFAFGVVKGMGIPWQTALAAVFFSGALFLVLTAAGLRQKIIEVIPSNLSAGIASGIGLFLSLIGLKNSGLILPSGETLVKLGDLHAASSLLAIFGLALTGVLLIWRVPAAMILGIAGTTVLALLTGQTGWQPTNWGIADLKQTAFHLDFRSLAKLGILEVIFTFTFVDLFDNLGTLVAVSRRAGILTETHSIPRVGRIFAVDACATMTGALLGTSTVTSYVESAAGIAAGGRTGVTAVITGLLFLLSTVALPLAGTIPAQATAPVLILVGMLMFAHGSELRWSEPEEAIPAFLTMVGIPLTFSIANGLSFGLIACAAFRIARGRIRKSEWLLYVLALLSVIRFVYIREL